MTDPLLKPGDKVADKYLLEKELGRGGMGIVFLATDLDLERPVAIKVLLEEHVEDQGAVARFLREAKASVKIKSEHVAHVYETGKLANGVPYIVMEYLQGQDLADRLEQGGPLDEGQIAEILLQACEALAEAHAAGIVHRDLKPANLFLARRPDGSDVIKILDFGISKISTNSVLTKSQTLVGSPYYMSPEQLESAQDVDARADIWAAGVIMYELWTGKRPFEGNSLAALCVTVLNASPKPLSELKESTSPQFAGVVSRCLQKSRSDRFQNVAELAEALEKITPGSSAGAAARVVKVLQNARTVPDTPRRESDPVHERAASWAQTNREATAQRERGRRFILATVVIVAAGGIGVALGQWVQQDAPKDAAFASPPLAEKADVAESPVPPPVDSPARPTAAARVEPALDQPLPVVSASVRAPAGASASAQPPQAPPQAKPTAQHALVTKSPKPAKPPTPNEPMDPFMRRH